MSVEGLRAWIAEVERKLGKRTRVFLALAVIAIGIAGASLYLAIDARNSSVNEGDVQELQEQLEARIDATGALTPPVETTPMPESAPTPQPGQNNGRSGSGGKGGSGSGKGGSGSGTSGGGSTEAPGGSTGDTPSSAKLQELLEQVKERAEANE